jgi:hypothetical protein
MTDILDRLVTEFGHIEEIIPIAADEMPTPTSIYFRMEGGGVEISAMPDDDSIAVVEKTDPLVLDAMQERPWVNLHGGKIEWAWSLKNNLDHVDGAQFLVKSAGGEKILLQMIVYASAIRIYMCSTTLTECTPRSSRSMDIE